MTPPNTLQAQDSTSLGSGRPVLHSVEHFENEIMNIVGTAVGNARNDREKAHAYLSALESRIDKTNPVFKRILGQKTYTDITGTSHTLSDNLDTSTTTLRSTHVLTTPSFSNLVNDPITPLIVRAIAEYYHYKRQEEVNNFDAIYLGQAGETESSTAQQIEAAAQRAQLGRPTLYYRNKKPLRIEWDSITSTFTAQYLAPNGLVNTLSSIPDIATLVRRIDTDSQIIKGLLSENVQQNVEVRESKKADHKQIIAAIDFVNQGLGQDEREARTGFYSIDNRNIAIRGHGAAQFSVDMINIDGSISTHRRAVNQNGITQLIDQACTAYEKSKDRKETVESVDMGTQFSEASFRKLCRDISTSKDKTGEYLLSGQKYTVREVTPARAPALARYFAQFPNPQGRTVGCPNPIGTGEEIVNITTYIAENTRTSTNQGNCTRDMGNEFSANTFRELCEEIAEGKNGRGTYTLAGKKYEIRVDQPLPADTNAAIFHVEYPNQFGVKTLADGATIDALLDQQNHGALSHVHVHDPSKPAPFQRETMLELCRLADQNPGRQEFDFHGKSCFVYKPTGLERAKLSRYCVDIPNNKGGVDVVTAFTQKGLYDKFIEHTQKLHHESEEKKPKEGTEAKTDDKAGHPEEHPEEKGGTKYDKTVNFIFGNGLIGKAFKGVRNIIPKGVRGLTGAAFDGTVAGAVIGGGLYLTSAAIGSSVLAGFVVPATGLAFAGYGLYSAGKRFMKWRASRGGGESKGGGH